VYRREGGDDDLVGYCGDLDLIGETGYGEFVDGDVQTRVGEYGHDLAPLDPHRDRDVTGHDRGCLRSDEFTHRPVLGAGSEDVCRQRADGDVAAGDGVSQRRIATIEAAPGRASFDQLSRIVAALGGRLVIDDPSAKVPAVRPKKPAKAALSEKADW
jgi:hypothetical protein